MSCGTEKPNVSPRRRPWWKVAVAALASVMVGIAVAQATETTPLDKSNKTLNDFVAKDIDGKEKKLSTYKGKVVLIVNVASKCGLTGQYAGLQKLYDEHKDDGLIVLGFPSNQFAGQEPGTEAEIKEFCSATYGVTFPMFSKIDVKGKDAHPLYQWLVGSTENTKDIEWNFAKFVIGRDGKVAHRFDPRTTPDDEKFVAALENALAKKAE